MNSFEWNKIFGAVLASVLIIMFVTSIGDSFFPEEHDGKPAYTVEVASSGEASTAEVVAGPSLAELMVTASADKGARQFAKCKSCHTVDNGGKQMVGPNLYGILGRDVANVEGFAYSSALKAVEGNWTFENLDAWLDNPKKAVPGNGMSFNGLKKPGQRADLIAYLRSFADVPVALPEVVQEAVEEVVEEAATEASSAEEAVTDAEPSEGEG